MQINAICLWSIAAILAILLTAVARPLAEKWAKIIAKAVRDIEFEKYTIETEGGATDNKNGGTTLAKIDSNIKTNTNGGNEK